MYKTVSAAKMLKVIIEKYGGAFLFFVILLNFYNLPPWMWSTHVPQYGDTLEALWCIEIWRDAVIQRNFSFLTTTAMYPLGLHAASIAHFNIGFLALPVSLVTNSVFALNFVHFAGLIACYIGVRYFLSNMGFYYFLADICSIIFTFALGRTVHIHGHWNVSLSSTFSIWMAAFLLQLRNVDRQVLARRYALASGLLWGLAVVAQPYALFQNAPLFLLLGKNRKAWLNITITIISMLMLCLPFLLFNLQASNYLSISGPGLAQIALFQSSLLSYVGWGNFTYWEGLNHLTRLWRPTLPEQNSQNWGIFTIVLTVLGAFIAIKNKQRLNVLLVLIISFILSLGPIWRDPGFKFLEGINDQVWQLGAQLKPTLFDIHSSYLKAESMPLPSILAYLFVPRYEYARASGRFSIWVGLAAIVLCLVALKRLPMRIAFVVCCIWLVELLPKPFTPRLAPSNAHPAHLWAAEQLASAPDRGVWSLSGIASVFSQRLAGNLPSTSTFGPFVPSYTKYIYPWGFSAHNAYDPPEEALIDPTHAAILRRAQVGIVLLRPRAAKLAMQNSALRFVKCFEPQGAKNYLNTTLCAFEVLPNDTDFFNIQPIYGFSYFEPESLGFSFIWIEGTQAQAGWRTTVPTTYTVELAMRAYCPGGQQSVTVLLNGRPVADHTWFKNCWERWATKLTIQPEHLSVGWNRLDFKAASAAQPSLHELNSQDRRNLSVGVELLRVIPSQPD